MLKYEEVFQNDVRKLIVKNITPKDFCEYSCEAKGERCYAKLTKKSPWVVPISQVEDCLKFNQFVPAISEMVCDPSDVKDP